MYKILRRGSGRVFVLCIVVLSLLLCLYYVSQVQAPSTGHPAAAAILNEELRYDRSLTSVTPDYSESPDAQVSLATCPVIVGRLADIDAQQEFSTFDFQVSFFPPLARTYVSRGKHPSQLQAFSPRSFCDLHSSHSPRIVLLLYHLRANAVASFCTISPYQNVTRDFTSLRANRGFR